MLPCFVLNRSHRFNHVHVGVKQPTNAQKVFSQYQCSCMDVRTFVYVHTHVYVHIHVTLLDFLLSGAIFSHSVRLEEN